MMSLHRARTAQWDSIDPEKRNYWQQLAARTHSVVTPANVISIGGFIIVAYGLYAVTHNHTWLGASAIIIGRLADVLDGLVAERTQTKSPFGEGVDAGVDKAILALALIILAQHRIVPVYVCVVLGIHGIYNTVLGLVRVRQHRRIHPSLTGKITALVEWAAVCLFVASHLSKSHHYLSSFLLVPAGLCFVLFVGLGLQSSWAYTIQTSKKVRHEQ